ncbi:MAG: LD-carboxypeptidase [Phycisphaerales bacterium]|nr:LD-carboxypeptidase [Phycisphaerales bacterium]
MARIHWTAPAGSCRRFYEVLGVGGAEGFLRLVRGVCEPAFQVSGDLTLLDATEDDQRGGRGDDAQRARDLTAALAEDDVTAIATVRGGAWLTRVLPRIDFRVLDRRTRPVTLFGFSELTTLVNIVASHPMGRGVLDMGPAFIAYGLKRFGGQRPSACGTGLQPVACSTGFQPVDCGTGLQPVACSTVLQPVRAAEPPSGTEIPSASRKPPEEGKKPPSQEIAAELEVYLHDLVSMLSGRGTSRPLPVRPVGAAALPTTPVRFIGGNLAVFTTLLASRYSPQLLPAPANSMSKGSNGNAGLPWLVLEDINELPYRIDRLLAHLTLADVWDRIGGLVLGDFHHEDTNLLDAVLALLPHHLPSRRSEAQHSAADLPIVACERIGHVWPMSPLPLNQPARFVRGEKGWAIRFDEARLSARA